jgi:hypothetical protein
MNVAGMSSDVQVKIGWTTRFTRSRTTNLGPLVSSNIDWDFDDQRRLAASAFV